MFFFFFSSRRRHTRLQGDWSSDVCSSDLLAIATEREHASGARAVIVGVDLASTDRQGARADEHATASTVTSFGPVEIKSLSTLNVSDQKNLGSGGSVFIRAGALTIGAGEINADR